MSLIIWDNSEFDHIGVNLVLVGTDVAVEEVFALDPNIRMMGPHTAGAADTVEVLV